MDFQKAFDTVPHKRMISKLKCYGIEDPILSWIENYLSDRKQKVIINGKSSEWKDVRDRPFNLMVFCFVQKFFIGQHKSQNIYFFCRPECEIFFQNLTLGYMTKTMNQIIFFSSTKIRIFFSATLGIRIFVQKKTYPPLQVKWSFPYIWHTTRISIRTTPICHFHK